MTGNSRVDILKGKFIKVLDQKVDIIKESMVILPYSQKFFLY